MSTATFHRLTADQYLAIERAAVSKSEFFEGEMTSMSGGSVVHNLIGGNLFVACYLKLSPPAFWVYTSEMKVKTPQGSFTYPDLCVAGESPELIRPAHDVLLNPMLVIEVLSPSTEMYDRGLKFSHYRKIESLQTYILVAQEHRSIEVFTRQPRGHWDLAEYHEGVIELNHPPIELSVDQIYQRVNFNLAEHTPEPDLH